MKILPVLDISEGRVVRGIAGRRAEYRPIVSRLTSSTEPIEVAKAIRDAFGLEEFYLADLDGIMRQQPNLAIYRQFVANGFQVLVDAGIRDHNDAASLCDAGATRLIVGLETCRSPDDLARIADISPNLTFGLDLLRGVPRFQDDHYGWADEPKKIIRQAIATKVTAILPLDLADVGMGTGGSTDALCRFCRTEYPLIRLIAGGGVRSREDLSRLKGLGVDAVLVASALHDGRLDQSDMSAME